MINYKLIENIDNIKENKYILFDDGRVYDIDIDNFIDQNKKGLIGLEDKFNNIAFYIKDDLLLRIFVPSIFGEQNTLQVSMIQNSEINNIRHTEWLI